MILGFLCGIMATKEPYGDAYLAGFHFNLIKNTTYHSEGAKQMVYFEETFETEAKADEFIKEYCRSYHPAGYGTYCRKVVMPDGKTMVKTTRGESCD
jgi:hypothetical protein